MKYHIIRFNYSTEAKDEDDWNDQSTHGTLIDD